MNLIAPIVVHDFDMIDSTQSEAKRRLDHGEGGCFWLRAVTQSTGRGRQGRKWVAQAGNYLATLVLPFDDIVLAPQLSFVTALALFDTLENLGVPDLALKWPNDVLTENHKIAGILLEYQSGHLMIGIGVNLVSIPSADELETRGLSPASLADYATVSREEFHVLLENAFVSRYNHYMTYGFSPVKNAVATRLWAREDMIHDSGKSRELVRVAGIDDDGAILVRGENGATKRIMAGDLLPIEGD